MPRGVCGSHGLPTVLANLEAWLGFSKAAAHGVMKYHAKKWEDEAKATHAWQNRTGETEQSIRGYTEKEGTTIYGILEMGGAGFYLETRCDLRDRFAMIENIINNDLPSLKADLKKLFIGGEVPLGGMFMGQTMRGFKMLPPGV